MHTNLILATDSYKLTHWNQYPKGTTRVYSYLESREGATYPYTVFFGLQSILKRFMSDRDNPVTRADVKEADEIAKVHFGRDLFNREGWEYLADRRGKLPLVIKAVPEGTVVPTGNVLMTVENVEPECWWLTNAMESLLTHVWYPCTVATLSRVTKQLIAEYLMDTSDAGLAPLPFMLHDFGYRGASSHESAAIGGAAHLVNFKGTDTLPAMQLALQDYAADLETLAFSVPATEHSVMTSLGREHEADQVERALQENPEGILSVVGDSYNIYEFVQRVGGQFKAEILARDGVFVVRPDSVTRDHPNPGMLVAWILNQLWHDFGGETNSKGFKVLDPHVRVLWGDGIDTRGIERILGRAKLEGFSAENLVFGMGGGLLQKVNRDTQRFAFKCSAQERDGVWHDIFKDPVDSTKRSKKGRLKLCRSYNDGSFYTLPLDAEWVHGPAPSILPDSSEDLLETAYAHGSIFRVEKFEDIRNRAALPMELVAA
jgi:nicotinamide phosphoribosyltransferase